MAARALVVAVFLLSCVRAARLSLVHDEALTFLIQAQLSFKGILTFSEGIWMPNNHYLNSLLIKLFTRFFGPSEFVIRIPALLGHALYLFGIYKIGRLFLKGAPFLVALGLLTLNPFVLDFFSCARGYGPGLGFFALGLYFFFKRAGGLWPKKDIWNNFFCMSLLTFSVFSHLIFLVMFVSVAAALCFIELTGILRVMKKTPSDSLFAKLFLQRIVFPVVPGAVFLAQVYTRPAQKILEANEHLNAGATSGTQGFWQDTVRSLLDATLYGKTYSIPHLHGVFVFFIAACLFLALFILAGRKMARLEFGAGDKILSWSLALLVTGVAAIVLQHIFSQREYATDRWVIYLVPLFAIFFMALWQSFSHLACRALRFVLGAVFTAAAFLCIIHCLSCVNFTHFYTWAYDASTKEMFDRIVADREDKELGDAPVLLGNNLLFEPSLNYYIYRKNLPWLGLVDRRGPDGVYDYYCLLPEDRPLIEKYGLRVLEEYKVSGAILAKS